MRDPRSVPSLAAPRASAPHGLAALTGLALLSACPQGVPRVACDPTTNATTKGSGDDDGDPTDGTTTPSARARRYVALVDKAAAAACPTSTGWSESPLFRSGEVPTLLGEGKLLPTALERFCLYTWTSAGDPSDAPSFAAADKVVRVDADLEVVVPQSASGRLADDPDFRAALREGFLGALGALPGDPMDPSIHASVEGPARIAVIDTVDFAGAGAAVAASPTHRRHGLAIAEIVREVRCPKGQAACREKLFHAQAFPYAAASPLPQAGGGPLGSLGSLAHAIGEALVRWRGGDMRTSPLILNLSLGWDPRFGGDLTPAGQESKHSDLLTSPSAAVPATVQAVHAAISYASCLDVLMIAAAGNRSSGLCEERGGLAPAIWERYPAIDPAICSALFDPLPAARPGDPGISVAAPSLVYAAGGVDRHGAPISLTRAASLPRRLLPADHALVGDGPSETGSWTGTSVAAASLSAIAGLVWSRHHGLTSHQVIALSDQSGAPTNQPVAIGQSPAGNAAQISAHAAYARLCAIQGGACQNPYRPAGVPASVAQRLDAPILAALGAAAESPAQAVQLTCSEGQVTCGGATQTETRCEAATPAAAGPGAAPLPLTDPWVRPQPDIPICPNCPIRGGKLLLSLNPDHVGGAVTITSPTLELTLATGALVRGTLANVTVGAAELEVDLSLYRVSVGGSVTTLAALTGPGQAQSASLSFTVTDATGAPSRLISAVSLP